MKLKNPDYQKIIDEYGLLIAHIVEKYIPEIVEAANAKHTGDGPSPLERKFAIIVASLFTFGYTKGKESKT